MSALLSTLKIRGPGTQEANACHALHCLEPLVLSIKLNLSSSLHVGSQAHSVKRLKTEKLVQQGTPNVLQLILKF